MPLPGIGTTVTATARKVWLTDQGAFRLPGNYVIDGTNARDPDNTGETDVLRAGLVLAKDANDGNYRTAILGATTEAYADGETTLTVSTQCATELLRLYGATGTDEFVLVGFDNGYQDQADYAYVSHSAINTDTGAITVSDLNVDFAAGSLIVPAEVWEQSTVDGTFHLNSAVMLRDDFGIKMTDKDNNDQDAPLAITVSGMIDSSQIINYPSSSNLQGWLKAELRRNSLGFVFDDDF